MKTLARNFISSLFDRSAWSTISKFTRLSDADQEFVLEYTRLLNRRDQTHLAHQAWPRTAAERICRSTVYARTERAESSAPTPRRLIQEIERLSTAQQAVAESWIAALVERYCREHHLHVPAAAEITWGALSDILTEEQRQILLDEDRLIAGVCERHGLRRADRLSGLFLLDAAALAHTARTLVEIDGDGRSDN